MFLCHLKLALIQRYMRHIWVKIIVGIALGLLVPRLLCYYRPLVHENLRWCTPAPTTQLPQPNLIPVSVHLFHKPLLMSAME